MFSQEVDKQDAFGRKEHGDCNNDAQQARGIHPWAH